MGDARRSVGAQSGRKGKGPHAANGCDAAGCDDKRILDRVSSLLPAPASKFMPGEARPASY